MPRGEGSLRVRSWLVVTTLMVVAVPLAGCLASGRENPYQSQSREETVSLRVDNRNIHDADLYLRSSGRKTLLGTVESRRIQFLEFGWNPATPIDLEIELAVGERFRLPRFPLVRGGRIQLTIAEELRRSVLRY